MSSIKNLLNSTKKNSTELYKNNRLNFMTNNYFSWVTLLVLILIVLLTSGYLVSLNQVDDPNSFKLSETAITKLPSEIEIEALVGENKNIKPNLKPVIAKMPLFTASLQDQSNYPQVDYIITPWAIVSNELSIKPIESKPITSTEKNNQNNLASIIIPEKIFNDLNFEQTIELSYGIIKNLDPKYTGLNVQINLNKLSDRSKKMLLQLLGELKFQSKKSNTKITLSTDLSILQDKLRDGIEANLDQLFIFCFDKDQCEAEVGVNSTIVEYEKLINSTQNKNKNKGIISESYIQTVDPNLINTYNSKE